MNRIQIVALVILASGSMYAESCRDGWLQYKNESCYYVTDVKELWINGWQRCKELGGHLATITSKDENNFAKNLAKSKGGNAWIGGFSIGLDKSTWRWASTFEPLSFTDWHSSEPNQGADENCLGYHKATGYNWHDYICRTTKQVSICEIELEVHQKDECCCAAKYLLKELRSVK